MFINLGLFVFCFVTTNLDVMSWPCLFHYNVSLFYSFTLWITLWQKLSLTEVIGCCITHHIHHNNLNKQKSFQLRLMAYKTEKNIHWNSFYCAIRKRISVKSIKQEPRTYHLQLREKKLRTIKQTKKHSFWVLSLINLELECKT